jgi:hypothetical protein
MAKRGARQAVAILSHFDFPVMTMAYVEMSG